MGSADKAYLYTLFYSTAVEQYFIPLLSQLILRCTSNYPCEILITEVGGLIIRSHWLNPAAFSHRAVWPLYNAALTNPSPALAPDCDLGDLVSSRIDRYHWSWVYFHDSNATLEQKYALSSRATCSIRFLKAKGLVVCFPELWSWTSCMIAKITSTMRLAYCDLSELPGCMRHSYRVKSGKHNFLILWFISYSLPPVCCRAKITHHILLQLPIATQQCAMRHKSLRKHGIAIPHPTWRKSRFPQSDDHRSGERERVFSGKQIPYSLLIVLSRSLRPYRRESKINEETDSQSEKKIPYSPPPSSICVCLTLIMCRDQFLGLGAPTQFSLSLNKNSGKYLNITLLSWDESAIFWSAH